MRITADRPAGAQVAGHVAGLALAVARPVAANTVYANIADALVGSSASLTDFILGQAHSSVAKVAIRAIAVGQATAAVITHAAVRRA